jgi:hypothetical protein
MNSVVTVNAFTQAIVSDCSRVLVPFRPVHSLLCFATRLEGAGSEGLIRLAGTVPTYIYMAGKTTLTINRQRTLSVDTSQEVSPIGRSRGDERVF